MQARTNLDIWCRLRPRISTYTASTRSLGARSVSSRVRTAMARVTECACTEERTAQRIGRPNAYGGLPTLYLHLRVKYRSGSHSSYRTRSIYAISIFTKRTPGVALVAASGSAGFCRRAGSGTSAHRRIIDIAQRAEVLYRTAA